ncbi:MAG: peptidoglycan DD-metalloendopeptidase family protein [Cytophagaceae bacterium]|nr:peptidoglycan DD-metalloendopeptidase family protein [Cytophagaceae bacterium]
MKINKLVFGLFLLLCLSAWAQKKSRAQLEKEKRENQRRIEEANKILLETKNKKKASLGQLQALKQKIKVRNEYIQLISEEVEVLEEEISRTQSKINFQQSRIDSLKREYADMVVAANRISNGMDRLVYIFSSESIAQMTNRIKYFQHYSENRKKQLAEIEKAKLELVRQQENLQLRLKEKNDLLGVKTEETKLLDKEKEEQRKTIASLSQQEKKLRSELALRKESSKKLDKLISDLIAIEREKAIRAAKRAAERKKAAQQKSTSTPKTNKEKEPEYKLELTPEAQSLSNSFAENKGKLPWPVLKGSIVLGFGKQPHPSLKNVYIDNLGVDIQTSKNENVRAVFHGKVITVAEVPGLNKVVMIQHGEFFTVYAKLKSVSVKNGEEVTSKQTIGVLYTDSDDDTVLQFQIWKNNTKLDPEDWLYKR